MIYRKENYVHLLFYVECVLTARATFYLRVIIVESYIAQYLLYDLYHFLYIILAD